MFVGLLALHCIQMRWFLLGFPFQLEPDLAHQQIVVCAHICTTKYSDVYDSDDPHLLLMQM